MSSKYKRKQKIRDPKRVFIFCEDSKKEPQYYEEYSEYYRIDQAKVTIVRRANSTLSSPSHIVNEIRDYKKDLRKKYGQLVSRFEFWMVVDFDKWGGNLQEAISACHNNKFKTAISKPCFEIWLLLHYDDLAKTNGRTLTSKKSINTKLIKYNLSGDNKKDYFGRTKEAIENAKRLDDNKEGAVTNGVGTKVFLLIEELNKLIIDR